MEIAIWNASGEEVKIYKDGVNFIIEFSNGSSISTSDESQFTYT